MKPRDPAIETALLTAIAEGTPLREYCRRRSLPRQTVYDWMEDPDFRDRMARARMLGLHAIAEEILEIADDSRNDWLEREQAAGGGAPVMVYNPESVARSRLRVQARLRLLDRWYPRRSGEGAPRYGDMIVPETRGGPGAGARPMDTLAIAARISSILAMIAARPEDEEDSGTFPG